MSMNQSESMKRRFRMKGKCAHQNRMYSNDDGTEPSGSECSGRSRGRLDNHWPPRATESLAVAHPPAPAPFGRDSRAMPHRHAARRWADGTRTREGTADATGPGELSRWELRGLRCGAASSSTLLRTALWSLSLHAGTPLAELHLQRSQREPQASATADATDT